MVAFDSLGGERGSVASKKLELLLSLARRLSLTLESCETLALSEKQAKSCLDSSVDVKVNID